MKGKDHVWYARDISMLWFSMGVQQLARAIILNLFLVCKVFPIFCLTIVFYIVLQIYRLLSYEEMEKEKTSTYRFNDLQSYIATLKVIINR